MASLVFNLISDFLHLLHRERGGRLICLPMTAVIRWSIWRECRFLPLTRMNVASLSGDAARIEEWGVDRCHLRQQQKL